MERPTARTQLELPAPVRWPGRTELFARVLYARQRAGDEQKPGRSRSAAESHRLSADTAGTAGTAGTQAQLDRTTGTASATHLPEVRPGAGALRVTRGLVLSAASAAIALAGHVLGGGHAPSVPALFVVAALVGAGFAVLADRRRGFTQILIGALASQPVFHIAFSLAEQHGPADPHAGRRPTADELAALTHQTSAADLLHQLQAALDPAMVAGHVVAAVGIAWLTAHGENVLWSLFELVARVAAPILEPVPIWTAAPALRAAPALVTAPRRQQLARVRTRRGPPALRG